MSEQSENWEVFWERVDLCVTFLKGEVQPIDCIEAHEACMATAPNTDFYRLVVFDSSASLKSFNKDLFKTGFKVSIDRHQDTRDRLLRTAWVVSEAQKPVIHFLEKFVPKNDVGRFEVFTSSVLGRRWLDAEKAALTGSTT